MTDFINYDGKKYPIKVSFVALNSFEKETGKTLSEVGEALEPHTIILWHALKAGHRLAGEEVTLTRDDMEWVLDESLAEYQKIFMDSMVKISDALSGKKVETKKK